MSQPSTKRDLEALIKAMEENRAVLKKTQLKMESLETAILAMQNSRLEFESSREKAKSKSRGVPTPMTLVG